MLLAISSIMVASDICGETVLVVLKPKFSHFTNSVDDSFWGTLNKKSA